MRAKGTRQVRLGRLASGVHRGVHVASIRGIPGTPDPRSHAGLASAQLHGFLWAGQESNLHLGIKSPQVCVDWLGCRASQGFADVDPLRLGWRPVETIGEN